MSKRLLIGAMVAIMLVPGAAVHAQDATPTPEPSEAPLAVPSASPLPSGTEDLAAMFPSEVLGEEVGTPRMIAGSEAPAVFDPILEAVGKGREDLSNGSASVTIPDGDSVEFQAIRIAGADAAVFADDLIPLIEAGSESGTLDREEVEMAGRSVLVLSDPESGATDSYVSAAGDVVWLLRGDEESVTAVIEALP